MRNEIIEKLNKHIASGLRKESDVVYLLVQIGKILEQESASIYPTLQFYRNWVVHYKLDRLPSNPNMKQILDKLEAAAQASKNDEDKQTILSGLSDAISLRKFNTELQSFFIDHTEFDSVVLNRPEPWSNLGGLLLNILVDLPLIAPDSYKFIKEFRFSSAVDESHIVRVEIRLNSGEVITGPVVNS